MEDADGLVATEQAIRRVFDEKSIRYEWAGRHDYGHDWMLWRINLQEFAHKIFNFAS